MPGILMGDRVEVREQSEGSRLYTRGNFGYPRSGGGVDLDLVEAVYLAESRRLSVVTPEGEQVRFEDLLVHSARELEGFDIKYLVYRDLRNRGFVVKFESGDYDISVFPRGKTMSNSRPEFMVRAVSERTAVDLNALVRQVSDVSERRKRLLYGVVDEEGDLTYYSLDLRDPSGRVYPEPMSARPVGRLVRDRVFVFEREDAEALRDYGFYGRSMVEALQLSLIEAVHLVGKGRLAVLDQGGGRLSFDDLMSFGESVQDEFRIRYLVYSDMRERGLVVKTGFKYGTHFRVYQSSPDDSHARYLVHAMSEDGRRMWPEISRTVRLSGGVKKEILFGLVRRNRVEYLEFRWFKPRSRPVPEETGQEVLQVPEPGSVEEVDVVVAVPAGRYEARVPHPPYRRVGALGVHAVQPVRER